MLRVIQRFLQQDGSSKYLDKTKRNKFVSRLPAIEPREGFHRRKFQQEKVFTGNDFNRRKVLTREAELSKVELS